MSGFKAFILRGNVVGLAVGIVIGAAFTGVVNALVKGLITPLIGALGGVPDFTAVGFTVNNSRFMVGDLISAVLSFIIVAFVLYFFVVLPVNRISPPPPVATKTCPECASVIPAAAKRCAFCAQPVP